MRQPSLPGRISQRPGTSHVLRLAGLSLVLPPAGRDALPLGLGQDRKVRPHCVLHMGRHKHQVLSGEACHRYVWLQFYSGRQAFSEVAVVVARPKAGSPVWVQACQAGCASATTTADQVRTRRAAASGQLPPALQPLSAATHRQAASFSVWGASEQLVQTLAGCAQKPVRVRQDLTEMTCPLTRILPDWLKKAGSAEPY